MQEQKRDAIWQIEPSGRDLNKKPDWNERRKAQGKEEKNHVRH